MIRYILEKNKEQAQKRVEEAIEVYVGLVEEDAAKIDIAEAISEIDTMIVSYRSLIEQEIADLEQSRDEKYVEVWDLVKKEMYDAGNKKPGHNEVKLRVEGHHEYTSFNAKVKKLKAESQKFKELHKTFELRQHNLRTLHRELTGTSF